MDNLNRRVPEDPQKSTLTNLGKLSIGQRNYSYQKKNYAP